MLLLLAVAAPLSAQAPRSRVEQPETEAYIVRAGDVLRIRVWPDSTLGGQFPVEETGSVHLPLLGALEVGGMALGNLRTLLRAQYGSALKAPAVEVTPLFRVSVLGAVQRPGLYEADPTQTFFDVISLAGGFAANAKENSVRLVRGSEVIELNAGDALESGGGEFGLTLQSGDRIIVPRGSQFGVRDVLTALQAIALLITLGTRL